MMQQNGCMMTWEVAKMTWEVAKQYRYHVIVWTPMKDCLEKQLNPKDLAISRDFRIFLKSMNFNTLVLKLGKFRFQEIY